MKIVHVAWGHYPAHIGCGPVIYLHALALAQREQGEEVTIICASDRAVPDGGPFASFSEDVEGIRYVHVTNRAVDGHDHWNPLREAGNPDCAAALTRLFAELRPDVAHVHNFFGLSFDVVDAAAAHSRTVVSSLHNYLPLCSRDDLFFADAERCGGPLERSCSKCLGTLVPDAAYRARHAAGVAALNRCAANIAVSHRVAEIYAGQGVRNESLVVERCSSVSAQRLWRLLGAERVARARRGAETPPGDGRLRLIFFGNAGAARKGSLVALQALPLLRHPERVSLTVTGMPMAPARLEAMVAGWSPAARAALTVTGGFTQRDLERMLAEADAAVLTPRWEDNGPQTVFEAQGAGLPIIGTRLGGLPDVIEPGRNGLLVEDCDAAGVAAAIDRLVEDPGLLATLRAGIEPPRRAPQHARALRAIYGRALSRAADEDGPVILNVRDVGEVAAGAALAHRGSRRGIVLAISRDADSVALAAAARLRGDLEVRWSDEDSHPPAPPATWDPLPSHGWRCGPGELEALVDALALAAAFPQRIPVLSIGVEDPAEMGAAALAALAEAGIGDEDLPEIELRDLTPDDLRPVGELRELLSAGPPPAAAIWIADDQGEDAELWDLAAVRAAEGVRVAVAVDALVPIEHLNREEPPGLVAGDPVVRRIASELGIDTSGEDTFEEVIVDGRDPVALRRAGGLSGSRLIVNGERLNDRARACLGLAATAASAAAVG